MKPEPVPPGQVVSALVADRSATKRGEPTRHAYLAYQRRGVEGEPNIYVLMVDTDTDHVTLLLEYLNTPGAAADYLTGRGWAVGPGPDDSGQPGEADPADGIVLSPVDLDRIIADLNIQRRQS